MAHGVFGAVGYRASLGDDSDSAHEDGASDSNLEQVDRMVDESGIVYGAEPIPREVTGVTQRAPRTNPVNPANRISRTNPHRTDGAVNNDHRQDDNQQDDYRQGGFDNSDRGHSPESGSVPVGRLGGSDLYITPRLTFDLVPAQPPPQPRGTASSR